MRGLLGLGACARSALAACIASVFAFALAGPCAAQPALSPTERHIDRSIAAMTIDEKISLISGASLLGSTPLPRLGIPAFRMGDGPLGEHDPAPSTAFAAGIALAATWDRDLAEQIGVQIGRDSRSRGVAFLLGPGMNIYRAPMNGRNHEYFGEDPFLAGQMAAHYVIGLQTQNVSATIKHFVGNDSEFARFNSNTVVSERALREIYLPPFEAAVRQGHAGAIMDSYNQLNGVWMAQNAPLNDGVAKGEWGFDGLIMSDWVATKDGVASANGGLDLEMPAGLRFTPSTLKAAIRSGRLGDAVIDDKVRRLLRVAARFGWISPAPTGPGWVSHDPLDLSIPRYNQEGRAVALQGARESTTLLKNVHGLLPLDRREVKRIAVIGPNAYPGYATGGGSGMVASYFITGPLRGISDRLGVDGEVTYAQGVKRLDVLAAETALTPRADSDTPGVVAETFATADFAGPPLRSRTEPAINGGPYARISTDEEAVPNIGLGVSAAGQKDEVRKTIEGWLSVPTEYTRWTGYYHVTTAGEQVAFVQHVGRYRLKIDDVTVMDHSQLTAPMVSQTEIKLAAGVHKVVLEDLGVFMLDNHVTRLGLRAVADLVDPTALELARRADAVVVCVGFDIESEAEGSDRAYQLPPGQGELIRAVAAANPNTIVVLNAGGGVDTEGWIDQVPALLDLWYPGQEGGTALADILFGDANPSGRLPISWERRLSDNPSAAFYYTAPGTNHITYGDDIFVGYRGYEHSRVQPLFPFGYGLSYTTFAYNNLTVRPALDPHNLGYDLSFDVTNTGSRAGADVAQLYVAEMRPEAPRPPQELKNFERVQLAPHETKRVTLHLDARAFAWFDASAKAWRVDAGAFALRIGRSSQDIRLEAKVSIANPVVMPVAAGVQ